MKSLTESKQYAFLGEQRIQFRSRPAVYIDGNHHGNEVASGEVPLYLIDYLLKNYTRYRTVHRLLNTRTLYIIPRVNPDAAEWYFRGVAIRGSVRSDDNDGDGRFDEDPPDDLDGDGLVGIDDLLIVLAAFGPCPGCDEDLDGDGAVTVSEVLLLISQWS